MQYLQSQIYLDSKRDFKRLYIPDQHLYIIVGLVSPCVCAPADDSIDTRLVLFSRLVEEVYM